MIFQKKGQIVKDLKFFERELNGVLPFEIVLNFKDTIYKSFSNIAKIQKLQESLKSEKYLSKSLSIVDAMKFISQSYSNGKKSKYELNFSKSKDQKYFSRIIKSKYFKNSFVNSKTDNSNGFVGSFLDSTHLTTRITLQIADIGTAAMDSLIERINYRIDSIINPEQILYEKAVKEGSVNKFYSSNQIISYRVKQTLTNGDLVLNNEFPREILKLKNYMGKSSLVTLLNNL